MGEEHGPHLMDAYISFNSNTPTPFTDFSNGLASLSITTASPIQFKKVIFNAPATIVYWSDGSKTVVKCKKDEIFDREKGLAMAISKKVLGEAYRKTFKEAEI